MKAKEVSVEDAALYKEFDGALLVHIASMTLDQIQESRKKIEASQSMAKKYGRIKKNLGSILVVLMITAIVSLFIDQYLSLFILIICTIVFARYVRAAREQNLHLLTQYLLEDVVNKYIKYNYE
jgi:uncharacterized membrane protein